MPLYQYRCKACGEVFEKLVVWSIADLAQTCPKCQSQDTLNLSISSGTRPTAKASADKLENDGARNLCR